MKRTPRLPVYKQDPTRQRVLAAIVKHWKDFGYPPTIRWICGEVGVSSTATVHAHIERLFYEGKIKRDPGVPRSIRVVEE